MTSRTRKYVLDTQLFIDAFRNQTANEALLQFHRAFAQFEYLSVVVAHELRAGVKRTRDRQALERDVLDIFERSGRMFAPSASAWHRSGDLLSDIARKEGLEIGRWSKTSPSRRVARGRHRQPSSADVAGGRGTRVHTANPEAAPLISDTTRRPLTVEL